MAPPMPMFGFPIFYGLNNPYQRFFASDAGMYMPFPIFARNAFQCNYALNNTNSMITTNRDSSNMNTHRTNSSRRTTHNRTQRRPQQVVTNPQSQVQTQRPISNADNQQEYLGDKFVEVARSYSNCSESDRTHLKFCVNPTCKREDPRNEEWCTDFVTYVVKEAYRNANRPLPSGFGEHDVERMKNWAINNNMFIRTSNISNKARFIAQNIKPGDIFIINENNASHTGFVTRVDKSTGVFYTIEGNRDDKVSTYAYSANYPDLSGFIRLQP